MEQTALFIVDAQVNMFAPENPVFGSTRLLKKLKDLLGTARKMDWPVVFIQNNGGPGEPDETNSPGWKIHPELHVSSKDLIIQKSEMDAFDKTQLHEKLQEMKIKKVIIAGLQSDHCIQTNCKKAKALGYDVILIKDAHSTFDSKEKRAEQIIADINYEMSVLVTTVNL